MKKFKVGDTVKICEGYPDLIGWVGKIVTTDGGSYGVQFNERYEGFHDLGGHCEYGFGYWLLENEIELVKEDNLEKENKKLEKENAENKKLIANLTKELKDLTKKIKSKNTFEAAMTEAILDKGKELAVEDIKQQLMEQMDTYAKEKFGFIPKTIEVKFEDEKKKQMEGIFHNKFETILKIVRKNVPLMLIGPAGSGKNHTLEQVAEALDLDFYFTNAITQEYKLTGFIDANGTYHETEFYKAFTNGGLFFLDEMDASCSESLLILNSAIANGYFDFPVGRKNVHKDFRVVAAANTYGTGADMIYVGRNVLDGATLDRFVVMQFEYDSEVERTLAKDEDLYSFIVSLRKAIEDCSLRYIVSMRATINASKLLEIGMTKQEILKDVIIKNMSNDDLNTVINKIYYTGSWKTELQKMVD